MIVVLLLLVVVSGTMAWLSYQSKKTALVLVLGEDDTFVITIDPYHYKGTLPSSVNYSQLSTYSSVSANNSSTASSNKFNFFYRVNEVDSELLSGSLKYAITRSTTLNGTYTEVASGTFNSSNTVNDFYVFEDTVPAETTYYYKGYIYIDGSTNNTNFVDKTVNMEFRAEFLDTKLYSVVRLEAESGSGNAAKYTGLDSDTYANNVYYFTGSATNTNVLFANHCWKMIRTTDTGGVKLLYNGTPTNGACNHTGTASQLPSTKVFNTNRNSPAYVGYMYNTVYSSATSTTSTISSDYVYGNSFTYSNGTYTLSGSTTTGAWSSIYNTLSNTHYTCLNNTGTCADIKYIYYTSSSKMYYITLTGGKSVNDALNEMLWADDVNETDSTIKDYIDTWYASNMTSYTSYLEDTVYCNDRSVYNLNGWNPNGGSTSSYLYFYASDKKDLTCTNKNDRFTMNSTIGNGKLTYPVGLMSVGEANLIGSTLRTTGENYWLGSPYGFINSDANDFFVPISGSLGGTYVTVSLGVRPVVSLKPGTEYVDGEGSGDDPFLVE